MALLIAFFLLSIVFSFLCSIWEAVLLSITPTYIKRKEKEKPATGKLLADLKRNLDRPLSAILTLNTMAHTIGAIGVGAQAGKLYGTRGFQLLGLDITFESIIAALMTLGILFLSEIIPKTLGANNWQTLAPVTGRAVRSLVLILAPFVWMSSRLTRMLKKDKSKSIFSKQDFSAMADMASESGGIKQEEYTLIKNVLRLDELIARDVMTPRTVMFMAEEEQTLKEFYKENRPLIFSRIPLFHEKNDAVTGLILKDDVLQRLAEGKSDGLLSDIKRDIVIVHDTDHLRKIFDTLNEKREHLAIVVDEYGGIIGLVTQEDIIETLLGLEIVDETDAITDLQKYARHKWEERARKIGLIIVKHNRR